MTKKKKLEWTDQGVPICIECANHLFGQDGWSLMHAFASVGIEHNKSSREMAESYFDHYHENGHKNHEKTSLDLG
jgi:hypothetical protein